MSRFRLVSKLVCLAVAGMAMAPPASAQSGYQDPYANPYGSPGYGSGYGSAYGAGGQAAAPSTLPGNQGGGTAVPQVQPPPAYAPKRKQPQPGAIPWGGPAGSGLPEPGYGGGMGGPPPAGGGSAQPGWGDAWGGDEAGYPPAGAPPSMRAPPVLMPSPAPAPATPDPAGEILERRQTLPAKPLAAASPSRAPRAAGKAIVVRQQSPEPPLPAAPPASLPAANERLRESYRLLSADTAMTLSPAVRNQAATRIKPAGTAALQAPPSASLEAQKIAAPALVCAQTGNTPRIKRLQPAVDGGLTPGVALLVQGNCFASAAGRVRVVLPTPFGPIRTVEARVLDWDENKLFVTLPDDLANVVPGEAKVEVLTADGRLSAGLPIAFEPRWEKRRLTEVPVQVRQCRSPGVMSACGAGSAPVDYDAAAHKDAGFKMPPPCRGIGSCFGDGTAYPGLHLFAAHYSNDDQTLPHFGTDIYELSLPAWVRLSGCETAVEHFGSQARPYASASLTVQGTRMNVNWRASEIDEPVWLRYTIACDVQVPVGVALR